MSQSKPPNFVAFTIASILAHSIAIIQYNNSLLRLTPAEKHPLYNDFSKLWQAICVIKLILITLYKVTGVRWQKWVEITIYLFTICSDVSMITLFEVSGIVSLGQRYLFAVVIALSVAQIGKWLDNHIPCLKCCSQNYK